MAIETTEDWNNRITSNGECLSCCEFPELAVELVGEAIPAIIYVQGLFNTGDLNFYLTYRVDYSGGGFFQEDYSPEYYGSVGTGGGALSVIYPDDPPATSGADPTTGTATITWSNMNAPEDAFGAGRSAIEADIDWDTLGKIGATEANLIEDGAGAASHFQTFRYLRFRFRMPTSAGTYGLFTYDIIEEPEVGSPSAIVTDQTSEWTGPGADIENPDDPSWFTDWVYVDAPSVVGRRYVANCRFTPFNTTRYGLKPQVFGPSFP